MSLSQDPVHAVPASSILRKSRKRWRIAAFVALVIAVVALAGRFSLESNVADDEQIARVIINGPITTDSLRLGTLKKLGENENVTAVIVSINSPGGSTAGGEELFEALSALREKKPVVAVIHELGASAAYMTAIAADRVFARRLSIVGSIGVLFQHVNAGRLFETIGIDLDKVSTGPLKAEPDLDEPLSGVARASLQALVDDSYEWFVDIVAERRGLPRAKALELSDGRILTGRVALKEQLIDAIGSEAEAIAWLEAEREITTELPVINWFPFPESELERLARYIGSQAVSAVGLGSRSPIALDGLVSLWQATSFK